MFKIQCHLLILRMVINTKRYFYNADVSGKCNFSPTESMSFITAFTENIHLCNFLKSRRNFSNVLYPANVAQADSRGTLK